MQPVTLPPGGQLRVPFVDRDVDAGLQQALGQAEAPRPPPATATRSPLTSRPEGAAGRPEPG